MVTLVTEVEEGGGGNLPLGPLATKLVQDFHTGLEIQVYFHYYIEYDFEMILHENHILYALYSRSSILLSQELHNNVFSGKYVFTAHNS